ncbi:hypothetical protein DSO57_1031343 [Entomophthora muscae]|uniref:Uncharacterized protein n=1 Tax=Entomophthora muscae TaxID=34485 RepID=A0ACC2RFB8_9FUNG|nr:hypothetical protein DSO57_1031343 [Entomophthora muscae]
MDKLFKDPNKVTVETVETTPVPPSSPHLAPEPENIPKEIINPQETQAPKPATTEPSKQTTKSHESKKLTDGTGEHNNVPMEIDLLENLFQTVICETWEPMDVSFIPGEVFLSALKKYQDKNGPALPIPALVNHNSEEKRTTQKPTTKIELGLSAKKILANTKIEITLEDFCRKSPAFQSQMHVAISDTQKQRNQEVMLSGYGAPHVNGTVDGVPTKIILDGSAYTNIISIHFLEKIGVEEIQTRYQQYLMADGTISPCFGVLDDLELEIEGVATRISASVFDHKQVNLLLGRETLKELKITTHY